MTMQVTGTRAVTVKGRRVCSQNLVMGMCGQYFEHEAETEKDARRFARYSATFGPITPEIETKYRVKKIEPLR